MSPGDEEPRWSVYVALCADGTYYTGVSTDVEGRVSAHNNGRGARYVRGRTPCSLKARRDGLTRSQALWLEMKVKKVPAGRKLAAVMELEVR